MDDLYSVLQVAPDADADAIAEAYHRLLREQLPDVDPSAEATDSQRKLHDAFAVLGDPERRRAYDLGRESQADKVLEELSTPQSLPAGSRRGFGFVAAAVVLPVVLLGSIGAGIFAAVRDRDSQSYDSSRGDDDYDLEAMALRQDDLPSGFELSGGFAFSSEQWAEIVGSDDPEATVRQLEAQGWLKNWVTEAAPDRFGKVLAIRSISTLYTNEAAAKESTEKFACGLPVELSVRLEEFIVPKLADQSNGFFLEEEIDDAGTKLVYTTICFRTGRIVHVVQEGALPGLEDIASSIQTAQVMLKHVDEVFEGKSPATEKDEDG